MCRARTLSAPVIGCSAFYESRALQECSYSHAILQPQQYESLIFSLSAAGPGWPKLIFLQLRIVMMSAAITYDIRFKLTVNTGVFIQHSELNTYLSWISSSGSLMVATRNFAFRLC